MKYLKMISLTILVIILVGFTPGQDMYQFMAKVFRKSTWNSMSADMTLTIIDSRGEKRIREIKFYSKKDKKGNNRMLMRFIRPREVMGTAFLLLEHKNRDDDRYLYLPALRRVKRIVASGKKGNFMSSDFTYYDIGEPKVDDFKYKYLGEEQFRGVKCLKIEATPSSKKVLDETGYSKIIYWVDPEKMVILKAEYYDDREKLQKILTINKHKLINGVYFATDMVMRDIQINHISRITFTNIEINQDIPEKYFSIKSLRRR